MVRLDELEPRLDPRYYSPEFDIVKKKSNFPIVKLKDLSNTSIKSGITPKSKGDSYTDSTNGVPFIRSGDLTEFNKIDYSKTLYIKKEIHEKRMAASKLQKHDILIAIVGATIGKVSIFLEDSANINQAIACARLDPQKVDLFYVLYYLRSNLGQNQLNRIKRLVARANINFAEIGDILIPLPRPSTQRQFISQISESYKEKETIQNEIDKIKSSIPSIVYEKLKIKHPENPKGQKIFSVSFDEVIGNRLDPSFYQPDFQIIFSSLTSSKFDLKPIGDYILEITNGLNFRDFVDDGTPYLRVGNIKPGKIDDTDIKKVSLTLDKVSKNILLNTNDILLTRKGTFGVATSIKDKTKYIISSEIFLLKLNDEIDPDFFVILNNTPLIQEQYKKISVGGIMGSLSQEGLKTVLFIIPPKETQKEIVKSVSNQLKKIQDLNEEMEIKLKTSMENFNKKLLS